MRPASSAAPLGSTTAGTYDISVTVSDGALGDLDTFRLTVTDTNHAPVFTTDLQDRSDPEGAAASLTAHATDSDSDTLTYSATGLPGGVSIDPVSGAITARSPPEPQACTPSRSR